MNDRLQRAYAALEQGDPLETRRLARGALDLARQRADRSTEARALTCIAQCERLVSRYRSAYEHAGQAAALFQSLGDIGNEAWAITILALAASDLGWNEEAVEASLLSVRLGDEAGASDAQRVLALNYLGIANSWSGSFDDAASAFDLATEIAEQGGLNSYQPRQNLAFSETVRVAHERYYDGRLSDLRRLMHRSDACKPFVMAGRTDSVTPGLAAAAVALWPLLESLKSSWLGELDAAERFLAEGVSRAGRFGSRNWLHVLAKWAVAELCWARGGEQKADAALQSMIELASGIEHEQFACLGHVVAISLFEAQGRYERAVEETRRLRRREHRVRTGCLDGRERVVTRHLQLRTTLSAVERLEIASKTYERLSLEDPLTGIPNRRCFERWLVERLRQEDERTALVSVALVDVDHFKQINDRFSHVVGDRVLTALASIMRDVLRDGDMVARLAGDEFVVAFRQLPQALAEQACARIVQAVAAHDWNTVAAGLRVSVSIGVTEAYDGDTPESLLHRSDLKMYETKRQRESDLAG